MRSKRVRMAWAIEPQNPDWGKGVLLGVGWFSWPKPDQVHLMGCRTALFATRLQARTASHSVKHRGLPKSRVVRVRVTVEVV